MDPALADAFSEAVTAGERLVASQRTVAVAESCTGGLLGAVLTAVPGSSRYMRGGVIAYANDVKVALLGVPEPLIAREGAVSAEVAEAMAAGVRAATGADIGLGITGVAGPAAEEGKPAGLVFVAIAAQHGIRTGRLDGDHGREGNRAAAVRAALRLLIEDA